MRAIKLSDKVWWVGAIDWKIRDFHGYQTSAGTTYNAYLIMGKRVTLIDTVKAPFFDEMISRISSVIDPSKIDYIVSNHSEMDHSGALPQTIELVKPEKIFASTMGVKALNNHFKLNQELIALKDGESLDLGDIKLTVYETRMLHWPDSMISYLHDEDILFSQDGFGMHLASSERFDDELDPHILEHESAKYFANILLPYSQLITNLVEKLGTLKLPLKMIAPDHGPIWRTNINEIIGYYSKWALQKPTKKAVIVYDTMWQSTAKMAKIIGEGLIQNNISYKLISLDSNHRSDVVTELLDSGAIILGSPTLNNNILPTVADLLCYLKGLKPKNLIGGIFGSYGWSGEAVKQIKESFDQMNIEIIGEPINVKYVPQENDLEKCLNLGLLIAKRLANIQ